MFLAASCCRSIAYLLCYASSSAASDTCFFSSLFSFLNFSDWRCVFFSFSYNSFICKLSSSILGCSFYTCYWYACIFFSASYRSCFVRAMSLSFSSNLDSWSINIDWSFCFSSLSYSIKLCCCSIRRSSTSWRTPKLLFGKRTAL